MTVDQQPAPSVAASSVSPKLLLAVFTTAIFLSAALLFAVQPMFAKMVLPRLGGSPAVWSVAMVFFQAVLLLGYAYAHLITKILPGRYSVFIHLAVMIVATIALPLAIAAGWGRPPQEGEALWLLGLFGVSIGLPFFALSANGPLLQAWFARTGHPDAKDPYFLYAASNVGSFLALLSYPFLIEPFSRLGHQTFGWSVGFYALIALLAVCGVFMLRSRNALPDIADDAGAAPTLSDALIWIALAAVPSGLLIAVTAHISTDVAASPFLWVIPLALYLATFVIAFQSKPLLPHKWMTLIQPVAIVLLVVWYAMAPSEQIVWALVINIVGFFLLAMVCHGELAARRPPARYLTTFYLCLSLGGVIGGIFAGLIALRLFSWVAEYPLLIVFAALCRPGLTRPRGWIDAVFLALVVAMALMMIGIANIYRPELSDTEFSIWAGLILALAFVLQRNTLKFTTLIALAFVFTVLFGADSGRRDFVRSFFGVHKVVEVDDGQFRVLKHGTTEHGAQRIRDERGRPVTGRPEVLTYYHSQSPMAQGLKAVRARKGAPIRIAVVGLGTGSLACQIKPGDALDYYEIDPAVVRIARDPNRFSYLSSCAPDVKIILGDARLTLADAPDGQYDILIVDAFSSDAIPTHLLTKEAMAIFARKIVPDGLVLMHVSNKHMSLASVVAGIAQANGLVALMSEGDQGNDDNEHKFSSTVVAVARKEADFGALAESDEWSEEEPDAKEWVWTDDYSNVIGAMIRQMRED
jgi:hypothetical protein